MTSAFHNRAWALWSLVVSLAGGFSAVLAQPAFERIHSFGFPAQLGDSPKAGVIEGSDGWLYGTTTYGGRPDAGTVFRVRKDGAGYLVLHAFGEPEGDGTRPIAELLQGSDGRLYGTTWDGGTAGFGTLFRLNPDGTAYKVLLNFDGSSQGNNASAALTEGSDGKLYGAAQRGGPSGGGTVFRLSKDGSGFELLHAFGGGPEDGSEPNGPLLLSSDGSVYGITLFGGVTGTGTLYKMNRDGSGFTLLHTFAAATEGRNCCGNVLEGADHRLYGVTSAGGTYGGGTLYAVQPDGSGLVVLRHFGQAGDGSELDDGLVQGKDGALYGMTFTGGPYMNGTLFRIQPEGSGYTVLHNFNGATDDGYRPQGPLCVGSDGAVYGTTTKGGLANIGALFRASTDGSDYRVLRSFNVGGGDATTVSARLFEASNGALYGMGTDGGALEGGAIFRVNKDGTGYSVLHDFTWQSDDACNPYGSFVEGTNGMLYGTTGYGGGSNHGTIFRISQDGTGYQILHRFTGTNENAAYPSASLLLSPDGYLYGRTISGGTSNGAAVFRIAHDGSGFKVLYSFDQDGGYLYSPDPNLIEGADGALYSTTYSDGSNYRGTVWRVNKDGSGFKLLHTFSEGGGDGYYPDGGLLQDADGTLYGTTTYGGTFDSGTLFRVSPDGSGYAVVYNFNPTNSEGHWPRGDLVSGGRGVLIGVTYVGGLEDGGSIYVFNANTGACVTLHSFTQNEGFDPMAGLILARDGRLYGATPYGSDLGQGSLFRLPLLTMEPELFAGLFQLKFTGVPGHAYAIEASEKLTPPTEWIEMGVVTNLSGTVTWTDPQPMARNRFYRALWLPSW